MPDSKLERALVAYLIGADCGTAADVLNSMSSEGRTFPNTTIFPMSGSPEPKFTGDYRIQAWFSIKGSASQAVDAPARTAELAFRTRVQKTFDALMQTDNEQDLSYTAAAITAAGRALATDPNDADMADFTVILWEDAGFGQGKAEAEGHDWERVLIFSAIVASANTD